MSYQAFLRYRQDNPGSKSPNAHKFWKLNGGRDKPGYTQQWRQQRQQRQNRQHRVALRTNNKPTKSQSSKIYARPGAKNYTITVEKGATLNNNMS